jgi:hypothetical protein
LEQALWKVKIRYGLVFMLGKKHEDVYLYTVE